MSKRTTAILLIAVVALGAMTGVAAADSHLEVAVDKDADGTSTVTVTDNGTAVENATVSVSVVDPANESYAGAGEYETDANGTVGLEAPAADVTVEITATSGNETASTTADLEAPDGLELDVANTDSEPVVTVTNDDEAVANASVSVTTADDQNATYAGEGEYETDENGTVTLDAAEENVTVDVTATYENESVSTTADLTVGGEGDEADEQTFGQLVREFIDGLENRDGGIGSAVSDFVTENNPGNAPDHAGGPGGPNDGNASDENASAPGNGNGNAPDHAGGPDGENDSDERGPPAHAGGPGGDDADDADDEDVEADDAEDDEEDEEDDEEGDEADDDDGESGPPDHAGGPGGN